MAKIIVVDDEPEMREHIKDILKKANHEVVLMGSGKKALAAISEEHFDLIITDVVMRDFNGLDLIMEIRQVKPRMKIIAICGAEAQGRFDYLPIAKLAGAPLIIEKPFQPKKFLREVKELLLEASAPS